MSENLTQTLARNPMLASAIAQADAFPLLNASGSGTGKDAAILVSELMKALTGYNASTNSTGNTTITPGVACISHSEFTTVSGSGTTTRIMVLAVSNSPVVGARLIHRLALPATAEITIEWRNATSGGTLITSMLTDGSGDDAVVGILLRRQRMAISQIHKSGQRMKTKAILWASCLALCVPLFGQQPRNVQASTVAATRDQITADLKFGSGRTESFLAGSTLSISGTLSGTPTGGTLNLSALTLSLPPAFLSTAQITGATGMLARTGTNTFSARTITGTANQITVSNGDGVSGAPTISIATDPTLTGNATVSGNLTVSGTGTHTFAGNVASTGIIYTTKAADSTNGNFLLQHIAGGQAIRWASQNYNVLLYQVGDTPALRTNSALTVDGILTVSSVATFAANVRIPTGAGLYLDGGSDTYISENTANRFQVVTGGSEALGLTSSLATFPGSVTLSAGTGTIGVGTAASTSTGITLSNASLTGTTQRGVYAAPLATSAATSFAIGVHSQMGTANTAFTATQLAHFWASNMVKGAASTVTSQYGLYVESLTGASSNYALYTNTGLVRFGDDVSTAGSLTVAGTVIHSQSATPASAAASGTTGTIAWDSSFIYICTATNTWKRVAISTW
jgi:hypothetical protein